MPVLGSCQNDNVIEDPEGDWLVAEGGGLTDDGRTLVRTIGHEATNGCGHLERRRRCQHARVRMKV